MKSTTATMHINIKRACNKQNLQIRIEEKQDQNHYRSSSRFCSQESSVLQL